MIGAEIGTYRIVDKIGDGGMGVVYKAVDIQLDRVVAVKALSSEFSGNAALVERFRTEARAQAQLNHPNLAMLYAFLVHDGVAYMVMEYVDGETFYAMLARRGPIAAAEAVPLFRQALAGIAHAHRTGIVHRDIKPSNIMLNKDGVVKVMDFGLAKVAGSHRATRTGVRLGTAYYMSPEQVLAKPVDVRSDIYSLGATLYEMLTAQVPFHSDSEFEILNDHVHTAPPPPSRVDARIPQHVENAVLKALAKDPEQRFQSAEQFSAALASPESFYLAKTVADAGSLPLAQGATAVSAPAPKAKAAFWTTGRRIAALAAGALACLVLVLLLLRSKQPLATAVRTPAPPTAVPAPAATQPQPAAEIPSSPTPAKPAPPVPVVVQAGTSVSVVTGEAINPYDSLDQRFRASLAAPVSVEGREVLSQGAAVVLQLADVSNEDHPGKPERTLKLVSITAAGHPVPVNGFAPMPKTGNFVERKFHKNRIAAGTRLQFKLSQGVTLPGSQ